MEGEVSLYTTNKYVGTGDITETKKNENIKISSEQDIKTFFINQEPGTYTLEIKDPSGKTVGTLKIEVTDKKEVKISDPNNKSLSTIHDIERGAEKRGTKGELLEVGFKFKYGTKENPVQENGATKTGNGNVTLDSLYNAIQKAPANGQFTAAEKKAITEKWESSQNPKEVLAEKLVYDSTGKIELFTKNDDPVNEDNINYTLRELADAFNSLPITSFHQETPNYEKTIIRKPGETWDNAIDRYVNNIPLRRGVSETKISKYKAILKDYLKKFIKDNNIATKYRNFDHIQLKSTTGGYDFNGQIKIMINIYDQKGLREFNKTNKDTGGNAPGRNQYAQYFELTIGKPRY